MRKFHLSAIIFLLLISFTASSYGNTVSILKWVGSPGFENDGLEPEYGSKATDFTFQIMYQHPQGAPPLWIIASIDTNDDGFFSESEKFPLEVLKGTNYQKGVIYFTTLVLSFVPGRYNDLSYYFSASDGNRTYSTHLRNGPLLKQHLAFSAQPDYWFVGRDLRPASSHITGVDQRIILQNLGNGYQKYALSISQEDAHEQDGWMAADSIKGIDINTYALSALLTEKDFMQVDYNSFNEIYNDDVITKAIKIASGPAFAIGFNSKGEKVPPNKEIALWLNLIMPTTSSGVNAMGLHSIAITITCLPDEL
ncbi:hypothetical protein JW877_02900 [bacterium]|nr:hypothetical protein [bacterium]